MSNGFWLVPRALLLIFSQFVSGKVEMQDTHIKNQSVRAFELEEEHRVSHGVFSRSREPVNVRMREPRFLAYFFGCD